MKRTILTGILAIGAGAMCLMAQTKAPAKTAPAGQAAPAAPAAPKGPSGC